MFPEMFDMIFPKSSSEGLLKTPTLGYLRERCCTQDKAGGRVEESSDFHKFALTNNQD